MKWKRFMLRYGMGQAIIPVFAAVVTWYPQFTTPFFILYFIVIMGIMFIITRRTMRGGKKEDEKFVRKSREIVRAKTKEIQSLMLRDEKLAADMKAQLPSMLFIFVPFIIIIMMFPILGGIVSVMTKEGTTERFLANIGLYEMFFMVSIFSTIAMKISAKRRGYSSLLVPTDYIVTEKGLVATVGAQKIVLKFPIKAKRIHVDEERGFVEIDADVGGLMSMHDVPPRLRLYSKKPRELWEILRENIILEGE